MYSKLPKMVILAELGLYPSLGTKVHFIEMALETMRQSSDIKPPESEHFRDSVNVALPRRSICGTDENMFLPVYDVHQNMFVER